MATNFPPVVECGDPLATAFPAARTILAHGRQEWAGGACWQKLQLVHRISGYSIAGSAMRWDGEAWGCLTISRDGTRGGQWYRSEQEARAAFDKRNNAPLPCAMVQA